MSNSGFVSPVFIRCQNNNFVSIHYRLTSRQLTDEMDVVGEKCFEGNDNENDHSDESLLRIGKKGLEVVRDFEFVDRTNCFLLKLTLILTIYWLLKEIYMKKIIILK